MSAHTPGPWNLGNPGLRGSDAHMCQVMTAYATKNEGATIGCYDVICRTWSPDCTVSSVRLTREECFANARLIAAAPELLKALQELVNVHSAGAANETIALDFWDHAKHAIAKATGGEA